MSAVVPAGRRRVRSGDHAEAVGAGGVGELSNDLALIVDASCKGVTGGRGVIDGEVGAAAQEKAVTIAPGEKSSDDLACVVDAEGLGLALGQGIVQGG
jgi:hypothetical protein